jgi:hypothetical protein
MKALRSEAWNDHRLDDLNDKVDRIDRRVDDLHRHMDNRFGQVDARLVEMEARFDSRFDSLQRTLFQGAIAMSAAFLTGAAAIVATQL